MLKGLGFAVAAVAALAITPAGAQDRYRRAAPLAGENRASDRQGMHALARCIAARQQQQALIVLGMDFRSEGYARALANLVDDKPCLRETGTRSARASGLLFAGPLAESLLRMSGGGSLASRVAPVQGRPPIAGRSPTEVMALCTVITAPAGVETLLAATPGSPQEASALAALQPTARGCTPPGRAMQVSTVALRAMLATAALRLQRYQAGDAV